MRQTETLSGLTSVEKLYPQDNRWRTSALITFRMYHVSDVGTGKDLYGCCCVVSRTLGVNTALNDDITL